MAKRGIVSSIWKSTLALFLIQTGVVVAVSLGYDIDMRNYAWLLVASPLFHVVIGVTLSALWKLFRKEDGQLLPRVNLPNFLSMTRLSASPTLLWLVLIAETHPVVPVVAPLTALVFLTDLLDGQISRRTRQVTEIGKYLDSSSDYTLLAVISVAMVSYQIIPLWLFIVVLVRLGLQWLAQAVLFVLRGWTVPFRTSFLGKTSVFTIMVFYAIALLTLLPALPPWYTVMVTVSGYLTATVAGVSLVEKIYIFIVDLKSTVEVRKRQPS
jgi:cardiolipin synthase (CMP-forming)